MRNTGSETRAPPGQRNKDNIIMSEKQLVDRNSDVGVARERTSAAVSH